MYKTGGWQRWGHWLGTPDITPDEAAVINPNSRVHQPNNSYLPFAKAIAFVHTLDIKTARPSQIL